MESNAEVNLLFDKRIETAFLLFKRITKVHWQKPLTEIVLKGISDSGEFDFRPAKFSGWSSTLVARKLGEELNFEYRINSEVPEVFIEQLKRNKEMFEGEIARV